MSTLDLSAVELRRLIGTRQLSPVELLDDAIDRIETIDASLNAVVATDFDRARVAAKEAERAVVSGRSLGQLHGIPTLIKDLSETAGLRTTFGSLVHKDYVPTVDDDAVAAIRAAGAIILGKSNTPEFGAGAVTTNRVYGSTGNPFDPAMTCGGSSGGSAVAVATGMVPIAHGSDYGASLRNPAGFCGCVGFRPTPGMVPYGQRAMTIMPFSVEGPMARNVADAALMLCAMNTASTVDPYVREIDPLLRAPLRPADLATLRLAVTEDLGCAPVANRVRAVFRSRAEQLSGLFGSTADRTPDFGDVHRTYEVLRGVAYARRAEVYKDRLDDLSPQVIENIEQGLSYSAADVGAALADQAGLYGRVRRFFDDFDVLVAPVTAVPAFPRDQLYVNEVDGETMPHYTTWTAITYAISMTLHPAVSIPCGTDDNGMPFGLQVVGRFGEDRRVLEIAAALEHAFASLDLCRPEPDLAALAS